MADGPVPSSPPRASFHPPTEQQPHLREKESGWRSGFAGEVQRDQGAPILFSHAQPNGRMLQVPCFLWVVPSLSSSSSSSEASALDAGKHPENGLGI